MDEAACGRMLSRRAFSSSGLRGRSLSSGSFGGCINLLSMMVKQGNARVAHKGRCWLKTSWGASDAAVTAEARQALESNRSRRLQAPSGVQMLSVLKVFMGWAPLA
jgi:hypothetical protein